MKHKHSLPYRIFSVVLSFAIVMPTTLSLIGDSGSARAITSLPYIEELKQSNSTFNILEIVPDASQGSIGYYIDGQEPCANWAKDAAKSANATSPATRKTYIDNLFAKLTLAGLLGTNRDNTTPLEKTSSYSEKLPWEDHAAGYTKLILDHKETANNVSGTFSLATDGNGAYVQSNDFTFTLGGNYVQVINYFSTDTKIQVGAKYYYAPEFVQIPDTSNVAGGTAVYSLTGGIYKYEGTVGASDFPGMEIGQTYYYVTGYGAPQASSDDTHKYLAISSAYRLTVGTETGYFNAVNLKYTYVGAGGTYNFVYNTSGVSYNIDYNTVFYTGGFTNNNWFLRYVLDWSPENGEPKPNITFNVKSMVANDTNLTVDQVDWATFVVLSNGFVPGGTATAYSNTIDISDAVSSSITAAVKKSSETDTNFNLPVIVDNRLISSLAPNLQALATSLKGTSTYDSFIDSSVFFFSPETTTRTALATKDLRAFYGSSSYSISGSAFYAAYEEIIYENFLRTTASSTAITLEEKVNMAWAVRYIVNFAGKRVITPKTIVNVLEIQPGSGSKLTSSLVKTWLGYASDSTSITVNINTMSTAELIGKIDVISEKYDIVYVGSEVQGFNPTNANSTDFNDPNLDGLIYSNIGDTVVMNNSDYTMSGLLDRDYYTSSPATFNYNGSTYQRLWRTNLSRTFRYSGNDLTSTKMQELQDFLNSGYPVIVSDNLTTGTSHPATDAMTIKATVTSSITNNTANLVASASSTDGQAIPAYFEPKYQWYSYNLSNILIGRTSNQLSTKISGTYLCTISYTIGGITYTAISNKVKCNESVSTTDSPVAPSQPGNILNTVSGTYSLALNGTVSSDKKSITFSATPSTVPDGSTVVYTWWKYKSNWSSRTNLNYTASSVTINSSDISDGYNYCCEAQFLRNGVNISTRNAISTDLNVNTFKGNITTVTDQRNPITGSYSYTNTTTFTPSLTTSINTADGTVTMTTNPNITGFGNVSYRWYQDGIQLSSSDTTSSTLIVSSGTWDDTENHDYYCRVNVNGYYGYTNTINLLHHIVLESTTDLGYDSGNNNADIPALPATSFTINGSTVDNSSYMYTLLDTNKSKPNFMAESELAVTENKDKLKQYVNLSKPEIVFSTNAPGNEPYPTEYSNNNGTITSLSAKSDGSYCLEYYFSVKNNTDTNPINTRYTCNLYVDANGDGRYSDGERLTDSVVREWNSATNTIGAIVTSSELKAGTQYYVSRSMPSDKFGIIPWKLEIIQSGTGNSGMHTSIHKYTHIPTTTGNQVSLDILQINSSGGLSLADQMRVLPSSSYYSAVTNNYYSGIYGKLLADVSRDFNVSITTVLTGDVNNMPSGGWTHGSTRYTNLLDYLKSFDMLITGFKDTYGDLSQTSAQAITAYIGTGKAILFTHDNTSFYNLPFNSYQTNTSSTVSSGWGYYFNMTIRDAVGLDRYGVTNSKYGISLYAPSEIRTNRTTDWNGFVTKAYSGATLANLSEITTAGYSLAYQPKSSRGTMVGETQGFTRGVLDRYKGSNDNFQTTSFVSQVNEGQITTYPYNVNTSGFLNNISSSNSMSVAATHFQYYQLNMNSQDTVVWYCLKYSDKTLGLDNDAANSYYIYSKGNVTYSGAGHTTVTDTVNSNIDEAKLFVNTMIAAYRISLVPPQVKFSDATGNNVLKYCLLPSDSTGVLAPTNSTDQARNIYFTINDTNIGKNKVVSATFSYGTGTGKTTIMLPIYNPQTKMAVSTTDTLVSGITYYAKIGDVWSILPQAVKDSITTGTPLLINITATTIINGVTMSSDSSLTLQKLTLFDLG